MGGNCCDNNENIYLSDIIYDCEEFQCPGFPELSLEHCKDMCYVINVIMTAICDLKGSAGFTNVNVGGGEQVFRDSIGTNENFRTLVAGPSGDVSVTTVGDTIEIDFIGADLNTTYDLASAQNGSDSDITLTGSDATTDIVKLVVGTNITITDIGSNITIDAAGGGEANTASNVGTGIGVFYQKTGVDLEFKSLIAGDGVTLDNLTDPEEIVISSTAGLQEDCFRAIIDFNATEVVASITGFTHVISNTGDYHISVTLQNTFAANDDTDFWIARNGVQEGLRWRDFRGATASNGSSAFHFEHCVTCTATDLITVNCQAAGVGLGISVQAISVFIQRID